MIDYQLYSFMPHTVTIYAYSSQNNYGEDVVGATRTARAYVEPSLTKVQTSQVEQTYTPRRAWIADTKIGVRDRILLPDGTTPQIASVVKHTEVPGLEHTEVQFT